MRNCKRKNRHPEDGLCFCPEPDRGYGARQVLAQPYINGWVNEYWHKRAHELAARPETTEEELWQLLFKIEDEANHGYAMWHETC